MPIDIHTHVIPATFPPSVRGFVKGWPSMEPADACHRNIVIDGAVYRTLSEKCWSTKQRLADMDSMGIGFQVISPMPELLSYWMDTPSALDLLRYVNDQIAEFVNAGQGRLIGFGAVPLQDIDLAIGELRRLRVDLGFAGVEVGSNVNGIPIGSPVFDHFFEAAQELELAVFVHAVRPAGMDRLVGPKTLQQVLAYPTDVGLAAASAICSNLPLRFPRLRLAFSHGGGTLASLLPRLERGVQVFEPLKAASLESPSGQAKRFYYDTLVFDHATLAHLVRTFGETQLMIGTDYPFAFREHDPLAHIHDTISDPGVRDLLLTENARRFLNLRRSLK